jgi:hypothetical protein
MSTLTAAQLQMADMTPLDAFGPAGVTLTVAGHDIHVRPRGCGYVVRDEWDKVHDFSGKRYTRQQIEGVMELYFELVDNS